MAKLVQNLYQRGPRLSRKSVRSGEGITVPPYDTSERLVCSFIFREYLPISLAGPTHSFFSLSLFNTPSFIISLQRHPFKLQVVLWYKCTQNVFKKILQKEWQIFIYLFDFFIVATGVNFGKSCFQYWFNAEVGKKKLAKLLLKIGKVAFWSFTTVKGRQWLSSGPGSALFLKGIRCGAKQGSISGLKFMKTTVLWPLFYL